MNQSTSTGTTTQRRRDYSEAAFQTEFSRYARHTLTESTACELKVSDTDSLPFSKLEEHQFAALKAAKHGRLCYKIADGTEGRKPFDHFTLVNAAAYVVVMFRCKDWGQDEFVMVDIDAWEKESETSVRRSLTEARAKEIGICCQLK